MATSMKRYSQEHKDRAQKHGRALFMVEINKKHHPNDNEKTIYRAIGTISMEKASRLFALLCEPDPLPNEEQP